MKITPDYDLLKEYLSLVQEKKYSWFFDHLLENINDFEKKFIELINENNLTEHCYNLLYFAGSYSLRISLFQSDIEDYEKPNPFESHNNDLKALKDFISYKKCNKIKFSSPLLSVSIESEYLIDGLMNLINEYTINIKDYPTPINPINKPKQKDSFYKNFCKQMLKELFPFLRNETSFKNKSENETYRFIWEFTEMLNLDWGLISEYPDEYLKDLKQKIKKA